MTNNELRIPLIRTPGSSSFMKASFNGTNAFLVSLRTWNWFSNNPLHRAFNKMYLIATGFLILEGDNLQKLFPEFMIKLGALTLDGKQSFVKITGLLLSPSMLLTDLSMLSYISATGVFSCLVIVVSIFCVGAFDGVGFHAKGSVLLNVDTLPAAVGLYIVSFGGHPVIPSI
ncbi:Amino acid transporter AVT1I [Vitis vinifera]|uniref:Amino acid transporter AVT1I n=1 Tax=Vitis vinifera TaxID=29760 RepID=A0A438HYU7_VITVI|nr:Amino acid transporter AVT1I [Vitis vinifera]